MMKQDNRPQTDFQDQRFEALRKLLQSSPENESVSEEHQEQQKPEKNIYISVNGNNNVISAEKSPYTAKRYTGKTAVSVAMICCLLFF